MSFPLCVEEFVKIFGSFDWSETGKEEWDEILQEYRTYKNCEKILAIMAKKLNIWAKIKNTRHVPNDCPKAYLGQFMSPDGEHDWTRLIWLLYCKLNLQRTFAFRSDLLSLVEEYLADQARSAERRKQDSIQDLPTSAADESTEVEGPEAFEGCTLYAIRKALGAYCSATSAIDDELSAKRRYIKGLNDLMLATELIKPNRSGLSRIIDQCEGLMVMIDVYMERRGKEHKYFETFRYDDAMTFDVRDVIRVIEEESRSLLKALPRGDSDKKVSYPLCAELLMQIFEKFDLRIVWNDERARKFKQYMQDEDSVKLLTYCGQFINAWFKFGGNCFKTKTNLPVIGPATLPFRIKSPDGQTDWTRMVWLLADQTVYKGKHNGNEVLSADTLSEIEAYLAKCSLKFQMRGRRKMWERGQKPPVAEAKTAESHTDDLLADVARNLGGKEKVPLRLWKDKLEVFYERYANHSFLNAFYAQVMKMVFDVRDCVAETTPDKHKIKQLIQQLNETKDEQNTVFRDRYGARFTYDGKGENIMDILNNLPEELKENLVDDPEEMSHEEDEEEITAPSRARSRSRSPDPRYSPPPQASPRGAARGGGGYMARTSNLSELLDALHALIPDNI
jgi:hypothetical protein